LKSNLAAFLATFIYAVVAITSLSALHFHPPGRLLSGGGQVSES
jgi:uncharacterized membrane protein